MGGNLSHEAVEGSHRRRGPRLGWAAAVAFMTAILGFDEISIVCKVTRDYDPLFPLLFTFFFLAC